MIEPPAHDSQGSLPLEGIRVVAVEQAVAAPLATRHLADLGAEVIKIERLGEGDFARSYDEAVEGMASHFVWLNRGKKSVSVDLKTAAGAQLVADLVATADVFVQNLAPGAAARLGLDATTLRARHPRLIVGEITGYGTGGPWSERKAYDMLVQAETGLISLTGTPDVQAKTGIPTSDIAAGMYLFSSVLAALFRRARTGEGAQVETSLYDATIEWIGHPMYIAMHTGRSLQRMGLSHPAIAPYDAFPTSDGEVLIGIQNDRGWDRLCRHAFMDDALADDPRFVTNQLRVRHRAACDAEVAARTSQLTSDELEKLLAEAGTPAGRVRQVTDVVASEQLAARRRWRQVGTEIGPVQALLPPMTYADVELPMGDVPGLGQHTDEVLRQLGLSGHAIDALRAECAIG